ncbi:hypothetical protein F4781DRAFT_357974 [Annulohypoxylon bovei var. microspora]|nr:hypothetical protein F4781DRAFT_357974 [Annulohypoxylon bovei var. microspora]
MHTMSFQKGGSPSKRVEIPFKRPVDISNWLLSPYLRTNFEGDKNNLNWAVDRDHPSFNRSYVESPTVEPLSSHMLDLLRQELEVFFYEQTPRMLRDTEEFKFGWSRKFNRMPTFNQRELSLKFFVGRGTELKRFFNKYTTVYFTGPEHITGSLYEDRRLGRYIFHRWLQMHNERPPFQRHRYFGRSICFDEKGPQSISEITLFHRSLCDSLSARVDRSVRFQPDFEFWPPPSKITKSWRDHGFDLGHLFRALFIVIDDQVIANINEEDCPIAARPDFNTREISLGWFLPQCSVLLVKTADDKHLSSPIDFQSLLKSGAASAVNRTDVGEEIEGKDVIRVTIEVAMQFILELMRREEAALPRLRQAAQAIKEEQEEGCRQWIEHVIAHAQEDGIDANGFTWLVIRQVQARLKGEVFDKEHVSQWWHHLAADDR